MTDLLVALAVLVALAFWGWDQLRAARKFRAAKHELRRHGF